MRKFRRKKDAKEKNRAERVKNKVIDQLRENIKRMERGEDLGSFASIEKNGEKYWLMKNWRWKKEKDPSIDPAGFGEDLMNRMSLKNVQKEVQKYLHPMVIDN